MVSNDSKRSIIAWELPAPVIDKCIRCGKVTEVIDHLCEECDLIMWWDSEFRKQPEEK